MIPSSVLFYTVFCIIVIYFFVLAFLKIRYFAWAKQPMFHSYDVGYWMYAMMNVSGHRIPFKSEKMYNISTLQSDSSLIVHSETAPFSDENELYTDYLSHWNGDHCTPYELANANTLITRYKKHKCSAVMYSRSVILWVRNDSSIENAYWMDLLVKHGEDTSRGLADLFMHHVCKRLQKERSTKTVRNQFAVAVLQVEEPFLPCVVPFVKYPTYCYVCPPPRNIKRDSFAPLKIIEMIPNNLHDLQNFLSMTLPLYFHLAVYPPWNVWTTILQVYFVLLPNREIGSVYFLKKGRWIGSIYHKGTTETFVQGFLQAFFLWRGQLTPPPEEVWIDDLGHNHFILEYLNGDGGDNKRASLWTCKEMKRRAMYLHQYYHGPLDKEEVFVL